MNEERVKVQTCNQCSAIWSGPTAPPPQCPQCKLSAGWTAGEVGKQPGMIGGRIFVPGTNVPMTRIFLCQKEGCGKMTVVRRGQAPPDVCVKCGGNELLEALTSPVKGPPQAEIPVAIGAEAVKPSQVETMAPPPQEIYAFTDEGYRNEWVADRVATWLERGGLSVFLEQLRTGNPTNVDVIWSTVAIFYDKGREQGFLP